MKDNVWLSSEIIIIITEPRECVAYNMVTAALVLSSFVINNVTKFLSHPPSTHERVPVCECKERVSFLQFWSRSLLFCPRRFSLSSSSSSHFTAENMQDEYGRERSSMVMPVLENNWIRRRVNETRVRQTDKQQSLHAYSKELFIYYSPLRLQVIMSCQSNTHTLHTRNKVFP